MTIALKIRNSVLFQTKNIKIKLKTQNYKILCQQNAIAICNPYFLYNKKQQKVTKVLFISKKKIGFLYQFIRVVFVAVVCSYLKNKNMIFIAGVDNYINCKHTYNILFIIKIIHNY